jgi:high-affinity nickel permease
MRLPKDLREFIASLNSNEVEYIIVGAFALAFCNGPRFLDTKMALS